MTVLDAPTLLALAALVNSASTLISSLRRRPAPPEGSVALSSMRQARLERSIFARPPAHSCPGCWKHFDGSRCKWEAMPKACHRATIPGGRLEHRPPKRRSRLMPSVLRLRRSDRGDDGSVRPHPCRGPGAPNHPSDRCAPPATRRDRPVRQGRRTPATRRRASSACAHSPRVP